MDLFKSALQLCKKKKKFYSFKESQKTQWLGDGVAFYIINHIEALKPEYLTAAAGLKEADVLVTGFYTKELKKFDLADSAEGEKELPMSGTRLVVLGEEYIVVFTSAGARLIRAKYLDIFPEDEFSVFQRENEDGIYFVVKEGMLIRAVIEDESEETIEIIHGSMQFMAEEIKKAHLIYNQCYVPDNHYGQQGIEDVKTT